MVEQEKQYSENDRKKQKCHTNVKAGYCEKVGEPGIYQQFSAFRVIRSLSCQYGKEKFPPHLVNTPPRKPSLYCGYELSPNASLFFFAEKKDLLSSRVDVAGIAAQQVASRIQRLYSCFHAALGSPDTDYPVSLPALVKPGISVCICNKFLEGDQPTAPIYVFGPPLFNDQSNKRP